MKTTHKPSFNPWLFVLALAIPFAAGAIGSIFTSDAIPTWYASIEKPAFNPPNWVFGPVWTLLYALQGIAFYIILTSKHALRQQAITLFVAQIIANTLWSIIFFGLQMPALAFVDIVVLWILIAFAIQTFSRISKTAAWLLAPYIAWVSFAAVLNISIALLN